MFTVLSTQSRVDSHLTLTIPMYLIELKNTQIKKTIFMEVVILLCYYCLGPPGVETDGLIYCSLTVCVND